MKLAHTPCGALTAVALLTSLPAAQGHVVVPPSKITIGDGTLSSGTFNGTDEEPFLDALDFLDDEGQGFGGQIEVLAGTYTFTATVDVLLDGVRIHGSPGAVLQTSSSMAQLFDVTGSDFALDGLTLLEVAGASGGLVRIAGSTPSITGCTFELLSNAPGSGVDWALQLDGTEAPVDGALVQGNVFRFGSAAVRRGGLQATQCRSLRIYGNSFTRSYEAGTAQYHGALDLQECLWTTLGANAFHGISHPALDVPAVSLANEESPNPTAIHGNYFEVVLGQSLLHLEGPGPYALTSNAFGRVTGSDAIVFLTGAADAVVEANQFHNVAATDGQTCSNLQKVNRAVQADDAGEVIVSDNTFLMCKSVQIGIDGPAGATAIANRFAATSGLGYSICAAIDFDASNDTLAIGNISQVGFDDILSSSGADLDVENHDL